MTPYLLAIDNGSQSTKVTIFDPRGRAVASARRRLRPYDTAVPGQAIHPGDDIWESIQDACRAAMDQFPGNPADIAAVGLCTIRFCRALLAADGSLTEPVLSWMDERVSRPYEPADPLTRYVTTSSGYITHRLTGQFTDAAANYQGVWPIDQDTATWSGDPAAYVATGMPRDMLFDLVPPGGLLGEVTARGGAGHGYPGRPAGLRHGQRQGRRGAGQRPGSRHRPAVAGHLHRGHDHRFLLPKRGRQLLGQLRGPARDVPVREHRNPPRHVDGQLVPQRAGRLARRRAGRHTWRTPSTRRPAS